MRKKSALAQARGDSNGAAARSRLSSTPVPASTTDSESPFFTAPTLTPSDLKSGSGSDKLCSGVKPARSTAVSASHLNLSALSGTTFPTPRAAAISKEAVEAAQLYYNLFFAATVDDGELSGVDGDGSCAGRSASHALRQYHGSSTAVPAARLEKDADGTSCSRDNREANVSTPDSASRGHRDSLESASTSITASHSASFTVQTPINVINTPYHTFFPPVLSRARRERIIESIVGQRPRPYHRWKWRKAADYHALHAKNDHINNIYRHPAREPEVEEVPHDEKYSCSSSAAPLDGIAACTDLPFERMSQQSMYTIPASQQGPEYFGKAAEDGTKTLVIFMMGLPARGKTFLAQKLCRLLGWHGSRAKVQNVQVAWRHALLECEAAQKRAKQHCEGVRNAAPAVRPHETEEEAAAVTAARESPSTPVEMSCRHRDPQSSSCASSSICPSMAAYATPSSPPSAAKKMLDNRTTCRDRFSLTTDTSATTTGAATGAAAPSTPVLKTQHFKKLIRDAGSVEREMYRYVLRNFAEDCRLFFEHGGEVVVLNDDLVTEELRLEAEALFRPLAAQFFYMEVLRDVEDGPVDFIRFKIRDPMEYPQGDINLHDAAEDFHERLAFLESAYETLETAPPASDSLGPPPQQHPQRSYVKIRNSNAIETHGISGYVASRIISYVINLSQVKMQHPIYFVRHGESCYNLEDRIGGNPLLTEQGMRDAAALLEFLGSLKRHLEHVDEAQAIAQRLKVQNAVGGTPVVALGASEKQPPQPLEFSPLPAAAVDPALSTANSLEIWTSQLRRAIQTAELSERLLNIKALRWSSLNEIHAGVCEDLTYDEVKAKYPLIHYFRSSNKYTFRYPEGESYQDLVARLEPVIMELENAERIVVVVAHQAVLRCLLAYFGSTSAESSISVKVPHRTVWRCTYDSKGIASLDELTLDNYDAGFHLDPATASPDGSGAAPQTKPKE